MTTFERFEREIPRLMDELSTPQLPDYLDDMLRQTARTPQRPAWSSLERWLPMGVIARTQTLPSVPWRPIMALGLIALVAIATYLVAGSPPRLPEPYGLARNGVIAFHGDEGRIHIADAAGGALRTLDLGAGFDTDPWFSNDGTRFVFERRGGETNVQRTLMIANADGSSIRELAPPSDPIRRFDWSATGDRALVLREGDPANRITILDTATGVASAIDFGPEVTSATWRPGTKQLVISSGTTVYLAEAESGLRPIVSDPEMSSGQMAVSPDGKLIAYATWGAGGEGRIHVVDIDSGVERPVDFYAAAAWTDLLPAFTPDGEALLVERYDAAGYRPTIVPLDGGPTVAFGEPHPALTDGSIRTMSPDGMQVLVTYQDDGTTWLFDVATTVGRRLDWSPAEGTSVTWQRLAP